MKKKLLTLKLFKTLSRPKDATQWLGFKDKDGNLIKGYAFGGSGVLWVNNTKTYRFGDLHIKKVKELLHINVDDN